MYFKSPSDRVRRSLGLQRARPSEPPLTSTCCLPSSQAPLGIIHLAASRKCVKVEDVAGHTFCFSIHPRVEGDRIYNISAAKCVSLACRYCRWKKKKQKKEAVATRSPYAC